MKLVKSKFPIYLTICLILCGCSNMDTPEISHNESKVNEGLRIRTKSEAAKIALLATISENINTRNSDFKTVKSVTPIIGRATRSQSDTLIYAVDFNENEGFALVSARKDVEPLLAIIDEGNFNSYKPNSNPAFDKTLQKTLEYASQPSPSFISLTDDNTPRPELRPGYYDTIFPQQKVSPALIVRWGQKWPEGMYCPNKIGGCGPVAAAQILSAMNKPSELSYFFPEMDIASETINWPLLKKHKESCYSDAYCINYNNCQLTEEKHKTIGRLVRQIGVLSDARYEMGDNPQTPAATSKVINVIKSLSGKNPISSGNTARGLYNSLGGVSIFNQKVAYVQGFANATEGHAWVADGIWEIGLMIRFWGMGAIDENDVSIMKPTLIRDFARYLHFNWGWNGNCNGYFLVNIFDPNDAYQYDENGFNHSGYDNFSENFYFCVFSVD